MTTYQFPEGFLFGAASSSHQVEGGYLDGGKTLNMWDNLTNNVLPNLANANDSCKSYPNNYKEDIKCLKDGGFNVYRFSMSWNRLLPKGLYKKGAVNPAGLAYYNNLLDELEKNGIEPAVTVYHWDLPHNIQDGYGGWTNSLIVDFLEDFAYTLFTNFGHRIKYWITINEPTLITHGYENGMDLGLAPAKSLKTPGNYYVVHNMLRAHARIYKLYNEQFRPTQNGKIGITLVGSSYRPKNPTDPEDVKATYEAYQFYIGLFAHPIYSKEGDYPEIVRRIVDENSINEGRRRSRLPEFTEEEKQSLKGSADFFGLNHYMTESCQRKKPKADGTFDPAPARAPPKFHCHDPNPLDSFGKDLKVINEPYDNPEPKGFQEILKYIKDNYQNPPILITENGYGVDSKAVSSPDELIHDTDRVEFYNKFLSALLKAIYEDGCNVIGYVTWSLLDNFEWSRGYQFKYGIVHVDFNDPDRKRTPKDSHARLKKIISEGCLEIVPY